MAKQTRKWLKPVLRPARGVLREVLMLSLFVNLIALSVPLFVLQIYDRVVFPLSRVLDGLLSRVVGKNLLLTARRPLE